MPRRPPRDLSAKELPHLDATLAFLGSIGIVPKRDFFYVEINMDATGKPSNVYSSATDTYFRLSIYPEEWHVLVGTPHKSSCVRVGPGGPFAHGPDAFGLLKRAPPLAEIGRFFRDIEQVLGASFPRVAFVRSNIPGAKKAAAKWVAAL